MATYYVRPDGNNGNVGTGPSAGQAWQTIQKALGASGIASGDTVYIAPGLYGEQVTIGGTYSATTYITGDPTASQFSGLSAGRVQIGAFTNIGSAATYTGATITGSAKNNLYFSSIEFLLNPGISASSGLNILLSQNLTFDKCVFQQTNNTNAYLMNLSAPTSTALNLTVKNCAFIGSTINSGYLIVITGQNVVTDSTSITNTIFQNMGIGLYLDSTTTLISNCVFAGLATGIQQAGSRILTLRNSLFYGCTTGATFTSSVTGTQTFCRYAGCGTAFTNAPSSVTSSTVGISGVENYYTLLNGIPNLQPVSSIFSSPNTGFGTATGAPATDMYGVAWTGATPDAGSATYRNISSVGSYLPSERNASTITIAPGSTSQSIELYLGATGLTASTSGLSARYNRTRTASVDIPLVARTIAQAWTSGGFAEVDATNMPGVYRLDVPDAALAAGADDVTIVVRGASGTNGAVMTVKLSSGGLTSAQTASAVWDASPAGYNDATTFGGVVNQIDATVTGIGTQIQDVAGNVWDELKANHTIPNSFGDYLDTKVSTGADTSRIQLRQGPFLIKQNAIDSVITEVNQFLSTVPNIEMVLIDSSGGSVSVAGATLVMRVRNQAGTAVVNNVTPTVAYADGGVIRWSPNLSWTALGVTTAGTYRIVVERTMSGVTTTFGPFLVQLSSG